MRHLIAIEFITLDGVVQAPGGFDAPRDVVFRHLVEPALIAQWWGPDGFAAPLEWIEVEAVRRRPRQDDGARVRRRWV